MKSCFVLSVVSSGLAFAAVASASVPPCNVTTISGVAGYGAADGIGSAAAFNDPIGLARDGAGNLYVADTRNDTIRKLTIVGTNWVVSTIAGLAGQSGSADGTNADARFNLPNGVAVDAQGNLFVGGNQTIRKVAPVGANWVVTTIAGLAGQKGNADGPGPQARFWNTGGLATDSAGNVYVVDFGYMTIRLLVPQGANWVVSTIANLSGTITEPNGAFYLSVPACIAMDTAGHVFVSNAGFRVIQELVPSATTWSALTIAGVAGPGGSADGPANVALFGGPVGLAFGAPGELFVADGGNNDIRLLSQVGGAWMVSTIAGAPGIVGSNDGTNGAALFVSPGELATDGAGNVFVTDTRNNTIRQISASGPNWVTTTIAGVPSVGSADGATGTARLSQPVGVLADAAGNVYVSDQINRTIRKLACQGTNWVTSTLAGLAGNSGSADGTNSAARFGGPAGLALDPAGNLYVADAFNDTIRMLTPMGTDWVVTTIAGQAGTPGSTDGIGNAARFLGPYGLALDRAGNLYVTDEHNATIRQLSPSPAGWVVTTIAGQASATGATDGPGSQARFADPQGLAMDAAGNLYVADGQLNSTIRQLTLVGANWMVTTIAGQASVLGAADGTNAAAQFSYPSGLAVDAQGVIYVADTLNCTIRRIQPIGTNWVVSTLAGLAGTYGATDGANAAARFYEPQGVAVDAAGNLLIADTLNNTIRYGQMRPPLQLAQAGNAVVLSWPAWAAGFLLETTDTLGPGAAWVTLNAAQPGVCAWTNLATAPMGFFRLRWQ